LFRAWCEIAKSLTQKGLCIEFDPDTISPSSGGLTRMAARALFSGALIALLAVSGCQSTPTPSEAPPHVFATVDSQFEQAWESTRDVMLQRGLQIYVRDKRGMFVAYTPTKRNLLFFPNRTKLTVTLETVSPGSIKIAVETIRQHYRVTLLTYPDWRDVPGEADEAAAKALLDAILAHSAGGKRETQAAPKA
jgi:hypothetical protein